MSILACIDQSRFAASVCDHAVWSAISLGTSIELLHVIERHPRPVVSSDHSGRLGVDSSESLLEELVAIDERRNRLAHETGRILLEAAAKRVRAAGVEQVTQRLVHGDLIHHLKHHEIVTDLLVVGRAGEAEDPPEHHMGRNLERVIRTSHLPVLVVPDSFRPVQTFLFAYDGGRSAGAAVMFLVETGFLAGLEGQILLVGNGTRNAATHLADATRHFAAAGHVLTTMIRDGDPQQVILETIEREAIDLLVMGSSGHSRIRSLAVGSTTTGVLQRCDVPLLVVRSSQH